MKSIIKLISIVLFSFLIVVLTPLTAMAGGVDIYVVFSGSDKAIKKEIKKQLSGEYKVKTYNTKLLAMADYSGKQKAVAKISKARLVVLVKDEVYKELEAPAFSKVITVLGSTASDIDNIKAALK